MTEGNTCYRGGKPGVSDVFAAALWSADYLLTLLIRLRGVNLHGGDGQMVANSLGGKLPGDEMVHDDPASHPHPYYTPIAHIGSKYVAEPVSYGMRFAQHFAGTTLSLPTSILARSTAAAYAAKKSDGTFISAYLTRTLPSGYPAAAIFRGRRRDDSAEALDSATVHQDRLSQAPSRQVIVGPHSMTLLTALKLA